MDHDINAIGEIDEIKKDEQNLLSGEEQNKPLSPAELSKQDREEEKKDPKDDDERMLEDWIDTKFLTYEEIAELKKDMKKKTSAEVWQSIMFNIIQQDTLLMNRAERTKREEREQQEREKAKNKRNEIIAKHSRNEKLNEDEKQILNEIEEEKRRAMEEAAERKRQAEESKRLRGISRSELKNMDLDNIYAWVRERQKDGDDQGMFGPIVLNLKELVDIKNRIKNEGLTIYDKSLFYEIMKSLGHAAGEYRRTHKSIVFTTKGKDRKAICDIIVSDGFFNKVVNEMGITNNNALKKEDKKDNKGAVDAKASEGAKKNNENKNAAATLIKNMVMENPQMEVGDFLKNDDFIKALELYILQSDILSSMNLTKAVFLKQGRGVSDKKHKIQMKAAMSEAVMASGKMCEEIIQITRWNNIREKINKIYRNKITELIINMRFGEKLVLGPDGSRNAGENKALSDNGTFNEGMNIIKKAEKKNVEKTGSKLDDKDLIGNAKKLGGSKFYEKKLSKVKGTEELFKSKIFDKYMTALCEEVFRGIKNKCKTHNINLADEIKNYSDEVSNTVLTAFKFLQEDKIANGRRISNMYRDKMFSYRNNIPVLENEKWHLNEKDVINGYYNIKVIQGYRKKAEDRIMPRWQGNIRKGVLELSDEDRLWNYILDNSFIKLDNIADFNGNINEIMDLIVEEQCKNKYFTEEQFMENGGNDFSNTMTLAVRKNEVLLKFIDSINMKYMNKTGIDLVNVKMVEKWSSEKGVDNKGEAHEYKLNKEYLDKLKGLEDEIIESNNANVSKKLYRQAMDESGNPIELFNLLHEGYIYLDHYVPNAESVQLMEEAHEKFKEERMKDEKEIISSKEVRDKLLTEENLEDNNENNFMLNFYGGDVKLEEEN